MAIQSFTVSNYKAFSEAVTVNVRPLTLLFGYNSAGKSALARWLPLLRDSLAARRSSPFDMASLAARGATFSSLLSKFTASPTLRFEIAGDLGKLSYVIRDIPETRSQVVESIVFDNDDTRSISWAPESTGDEYNVRWNDKDAYSTSITFGGLFPRQQQVGGSLTNAISAMARTILEDCVSDVYWLQAVRAVPPRRELFKGAPAHVLPDGTGVTELIIGAETSGADIVPAISQWYESATGYKLTLERGAFKDSEMFSFGLTKGAVLNSVELADTGEGMGQVLPIVGLLTLAEHSLLGENVPTLIFEQPELHLHQAVEPALAELLCRVAAAKKANIIAETHSESLLLSVQLGLIEGRLDPADVAVYWIRQSDEGPATASEITFDELGRPSGGDWPPGVFTHNTKQARELVRRQIAKERDAS